MEEVRLFELFDKKDSGTLSEEEAQELIELLKRPDLQAEYNMYKLLGRAVHDHALLELRSQMERDLKDYSPGKGKWGYLGFASLLIAISGSFVYWMHSGADNLIIVTVKEARPSESYVSVAEEIPEQLENEKYFLPGCVVVKVDEFDNNKVATKPLQKRLIVDTEKGPDTLPKIGGLKEAPTDIGHSSEDKGRSVPDTSLGSFNSIKENQHASSTNEQEVADAFSIRSADIDIVAACEGMANGKIIVSQLETIPEDTKVTLFLGKEILQDGLADGLSSGTYAIYAEADAKRHLYRSVHIPERKCLDRKEFVLSLSMQENWMIPVEEYGDVNIQVMNERGEHVKTLMVRDKFPDHWDLRTDKGQLLPAGYYVMLISGEHTNLKRFLRLTE